MEQDITIDKNDLKVKHATGQYVNLPSAPEPDDVLYYAITKRKKVVSIVEMLVFFGEEKKEILLSSLKVLDYEGLVRRTEDEDKWEVVKQ